MEVKLIMKSARNAVIEIADGGITKSLLKDFKQIIMWFCLY